MKNNRAFTLIELLVVVLIIVILSAVAIPQYRKAMLKSRLAILKDVTRSIANAQEIYYLANGQYATKFNELDIDAPGGQIENQDATRAKYDWGVCILSSQSVACQNTQFQIGYDIFFKHVAAHARGRTFCLSRDVDPNSLPTQVYKQETGKSTAYSASSGTWEY